MQDLEVIVDFNGIVLFDCQSLQHFYSGIAAGTNLYERFARTEDGDEVVRQGIVVPIAGLNDSVYRVQVRMAEEDSHVPEELVIVTNGPFPFRITGRVVIADMAVLLDWSLDEGWHDIAIPAGLYAVTIKGFQKIEENVVVDYGFDIIFTPVDVLPALTAEPMKSMQVNALPDTA